MCLAIPGKIIEIEGKKVVVDYGSERREARIIKGEFAVGDFVTVAAGVVSEKVDEAQVAGWLKVLEND
ncbi:MAG: HypC/HybG/HupF family hydrogenase formation chaperone [Nanoarchaeota archaeon]|nr:HypC/HybG/HupF family hydrogenase formation chaperone [Nanoarchaeota archaeon]